MHARKVSREIPKALFVQARGKGSRQNQKNWGLSWDWIVEEREHIGHTQI